MTKRQNGKKEDAALLTREEAAQRLGVTVRTVERLVTRGLLTERRAAVGRGRGGRHIFFRAADVNRLLAGNVQRRS